MPDLPPELLSEILSYLAHDQHQIGLCRLSCRSLHQLSSPLYLTTVVLAKRLRDLIKLEEVLRHPYFSKYVDTLIYDASYYSSDWADTRDHPSTSQSFACYVRAAENAGRNYHDEDWELAQRTEHGAWSRIGHCIDGGIGQYTGLRLYRDQQRIRMLRIPTRILKTAISQLPRLRRVIFSDFRALAREGESYDSCCQRLFGNTLEPEHLSFSSAPWQEFTDLCRVLAASKKTRIEELLLGSHSFEDPLEILTASNKRCTPFMPLYKTLLKLNTADFTSMVNSCRHLAHVRLPLCFGYSQRDPLRGFDSTPVMAILKTCQATLTHLTLVVDELFEGYGENGAFHTKSLPFDTILAPLHFECLRSLDLRGWYLSSVQLKSLLERHADTLRELHLVANTFNAMYKSSRSAVDDMVDLGCWAGEHLQLTGIEICGLDDDRDKQWEVEHAHLINRGSGLNGDDCGVQHTRKSRSLDHRARASMAGWQAEPYHQSSTARPATGGDADVLLRSELLAVQKHRTAAFDRAASNAQHARDAMDQHNRYYYEDSSQLELDRVDEDNARLLSLLGASREVAED